MKWPGKTTFMPRHIGLLVFDSLVFYANAAPNGSWTFHDTYKTSYHHESEREKKERHPDVATINRFEFCWSHHRHPHIEGISQCRPQQLVCFRADFFHVTLLRVFSYFLWDYFLWKKRDEWLLWFATALQRLQALIVCRKKLWNRGKQSRRASTNSKFWRPLEILLFVKLIEADYKLRQLSPQFVIQLYVVNVQQEPVSIIQMISLPVSFAILVWFLKPADEGVIINIPVKYKILNFLTHFCWALDCLQLHTLLWSTSGSS